MRAFSDPIFSHRKGSDQSLSKAHTMEAWLENRAYSTWPQITTWELRLNELKWQAKLLSVEFTRVQVVRALYGAPRK